MTTSEAPWLVSYQIGWESQIHNQNLPIHDRIHAVAMARCDPNCHTPLQPGELARLVGKETPDGLFKPVDSKDIGGYVKRAVELGWLDPMSNTRCLVLPANREECRLPGRGKPCEHHTGKSTKPKRPFTLRSEPVVRPTPGSRDVFGVKPSVASHRTGDTDTRVRDELSSVVHLDTMTAR